VHRVFATEPAILVQIELVRRVSFILRRGIIFTLAFTASEKYDFPHCSSPSSTLILIIAWRRHPPDAIFYSITSVITPAPTVLPPSRMAKRRPWSMAIGVMSSTLQVMLSPGITISTPSASFTTPVTSVVRK